MNKLLRREKEQNLDVRKKSHLERKLHAARVNLNYTIYYPLTEKYVSLYPKSKGQASDNEDEELETDTKVQGSQRRDSSKPALWFVVEKCMEEGSLDLLRDGKLNIGVDGKQLPASAKMPAVNTDTRKHKIDEKESKQPSKKDRHASKDSKSNARRDKQARKDYGKERDRLQDIPAAPEANDSDGGFFEE